MLRTRREIIAGAGAVAGMAAVPNAWAARLLTTSPSVGAGRFADSVASGDPGTTEMTFWSRLTTDRPKSGARLVVARDEGLRRVVADAVVPTGEAMDHCLKARIGGLEPGTVYYYVWESGDDVSPVGRTKTANARDSNAPVRIACSSCQNFDDGFFTGLSHAAAQDPWDLVLFLGDYTYETRDSGTREDPADSNDVGSFRDKLRLYRSDVGLRELHRLHPVAHIWDDHEVEDNYTDGPKPSPLQRMAGYRASFEWLPRMTFPRERYRTYKPLSLGRSAEVITLDERQYRGGEGDFNRTDPIAFLGRRQLDFVKNRLRALQAGGVRWKVLANQLPVFDINGVAQPGLQNDQWPGFRAERTELLEFIASEGIDNVVFVTGDIHTFISSYLNADFSRFATAANERDVSVATDYVCGSVTSTGFPGALNTSGTVQGLATSRHIKFFDGTPHGYGSLSMDGERLVTEYRAGDIDRPDAPVGTFARFNQDAGANFFEREGLPLTPPGGLPAVESRQIARAAGALERRKRSRAARRRRRSVARHHEELATR